jgi:hypothetical protein
MFENTFRKNLWSYVLGRTSLDQFKDWLSPATWDVEKEADQPIIDLVNQVKLRLAEFSNGHWNEPELKSGFLSLLVPPPLPPQELMYSIEAGSASGDVVAKPVPSKLTGIINTNILEFECIPA